MNAPAPSVRRAGVAQLAEFDTLIDVRSPGEFALDHIPGAVNHPVLDDEERARVGTMYVQESPFAARRVGAALVARNIARHIEQSFGDRPKSWRPLVYCWRGGQRSGAMATVLSQVGWGVRQLEGGYRAYRRQVISDLETLPRNLRFIVLHGPTGSGKTALLEALAVAGEQVVDLEGLANHRGSVLGGADAGTGVQPGQKAFESGLWSALRRCDPQRVVYVESESRRIGRLSIPQGLFEVLVDARCLRLAAGLEARVAHLLDRYGDVYANPAQLAQRLEFFVPLHGHKAVNEWRAWAGAGRFGDLARALVQTHYDPAYRRGGDVLYRRVRDAAVLDLDSLEPAALAQAAGRVVRLIGTGHGP